MKKLISLLLLLFCLTAKGWHYDKYAWDNYIYWEYECIYPQRFAERMVQPGFRVIYAQSGDPKADGRNQHQFDEYKLYTEMHGLGDFTIDWLYNEELDMNWKKVREIKASDLHEVK